MDDLRTEVETSEDLTPREFRRWERKIQRIERLKRRLDRKIDRRF
jgi:hypothetical protein